MKPSNKWLVDSIGSSDIGKIFLTNLLAGVTTGLVDEGKMKDFFLKLRSSAESTYDAHTLAAIDVAELSELLIRACVEVMSQFPDDFSFSVHSPACEVAPVPVSTAPIEFCNVVTLSTFLEKYADSATILASLGSTAVIRSAASIKPVDRVGLEIEAGNINTHTLNSIASLAVKKFTTKGGSSGPWWRSRFPFFWIAPYTAARKSLNADEIRDRLGILWDVGHYLIDIRVIDLDAKLFHRPTAFNAVDNTRFRALSRFDDAKNKKFDWSGQTADLNSFANGDLNIEGFRELVCKQIPWGDHLHLEFHIFGKVTKKRGNLTNDDHTAFFNKLCMDFGFSPLSVMPTLASKLT